MTSARLRTLAGLAVAIVPSAIVVHLTAEALALGAAAFSAEFFLRHLYLGVLLAGAGWWFCSTIGLGRGRFEFARRCALARARLRAISAGYQIPVLVAANAGFFLLTQACEGTPIATGSLALGLLAGALGSLLSALLVFYFGRSVIAVAFAVFAHAPRVPRARPARARRVLRDVPRCAQSIFSLFIPNRPPPTLSLA
jgi:hypothetical protein